ncbi:bacitracin ABC transporter ATP-binding protein [Peribacillus sp. B-H-3]
MRKEKNPLLSDEFLDEVAREISQLYNESKRDQYEEQINNDLE